MKKIFTLCMVLAAALSVNAQSKYGIYTDTETAATEKQIYGATELPDGSYTFGIHKDADVNVEQKNGCLCSYLDVVTAHPEVDRKSTHFNASGFGGNFAWNAEVWGVLDDALIFSSSLDGTDAEPKTRWTKPNPEGGDDLEVKTDWDLIATAPDYWAGFTVDVAAGKTLNVSGISFDCATNQNFVWAIAIYDEAGNQKYFSGNAQMQNSNSTDEAKAKWQNASSAYITADGVKEISGWVVRDNVDQTTLKTVSPVKAFSPLPAGGVSLTGKNTVRMYFACKNARLFAIEHFWLEGSTGGSTGIEGIETDKAEKISGTFNLAGQRVGADYKGIVIENGVKRIK